MVTDTKACGTVSGCVRHRQRGETPCDACRLAWNAYNRERRSRWKRTPRVPIGERLDEQRRVSDMLAIAVRDLICSHSTGCDHDACAQGRRALAVWAEHD